MGYLLAFEGWDPVGNADDGRDAVISASKSVPKCDYLALSEAGRNSQRVIKLIELDLLCKLEKSWSLTGLEGATRRVKRGIVVSDNFFFVVYHRNFRAIYIFLNGEISSIGMAKWAETLFRQLTGFRRGAMGYVTKFDDPFEATLYALDLQIQDPKTLSLERRKKKWKDNFKKEVLDRRPRDIYEVNVWNSRALEAIKNDLPSQYLRTVLFRNNIHSIDNNYSMIILQPDDLLSYRKMLMGVFY